MRRAMTLLAFLGLGLINPPTQADPPDVKPLAIGSQAPDFKLPGVDGKMHGLSDYASSKVLVIAYTCNH